MRARQNLACIHVGTGMISVCREIVQVSMQVLQLCDFCLSAMSMSLPLPFLQGAWLHHQWFHPAWRPQLGSNAQPQTNRYGYVNLFEAFANLKSVEVQLSQRFRGMSMSLEWRFDAWICSLVNHWYHNARLTLFMANVKMSWNSSCREKLLCFYDRGLTEEVRNSMRFTQF